MTKPTVSSMVVTLMLVVVAVVAEAQQAARVWRIGYVNLGGTPSSVAQLRKQL